MKFCLVLLTFMCLFYLSVAQNQAENSQARIAVGNRQSEGTISGTINKFFKI